MTTKEILNQLKTEQNLELQCFYLNLLDKDIVIELIDFILR